MSAHADYTAFSDALALRLGCQWNASYHPAAADFADEFKNTESLARFFPNPEARGGAIQGFISSDAITKLIDGTVRRIASDSARYDTSHRAIAGLLSAENFKPTSIMRVLGSELVKRQEGAPAAAVELTAKAEQVSVDTYSGHFMFSRQAAISSAWDVLAGSTAELVAGGYRKERSLLIALMDSNPTLDDGVAQFHADRSNIVTGALSASVLGEAVSALKAIPGADNQPLQTSPAVLAVPSSQEVTAATIARDAGVSLQIFGDSRLSAGYLMADPVQNPVFSILHIGNARQPIANAARLRNTDDWAVKAVHDFAVTAVSSRAVKLTLA